MQNNHHISKDIYMHNYNITKEAYRRYKLKHINKLGFSRHKSTNLHIYLFDLKHRVACLRIPNQKHIKRCYLRKGVKTLHTH